MALKFGALSKRSPAEHVDGSVLGKFDPFVSLQDVAREIELPLIARDSVELD